MTAPMMQRGVNVLQGEPRVRGHELLYGEPPRQLIEDVLDREPRAADDRLPHPHSRVGGDAPEVGHPALQATAYSRYAASAIRARVGIGRGSVPPKEGGGGPQVVV